MIFTDKKGIGRWEGYKIDPTPQAVQSIMDWIVLFGLPRLVDPSPSKPFDRTRMVDSSGRRYGPGVYIDPAKGVLVLRTRYKHVFEADYNDWIFRDIINDHFFVVKQASIDNGTYVVVPT